MWTSRNRARYDRRKLRYPSDVTDEEWELIVRLIPPAGLHLPWFGNESRKRPGLPGVKVRR
jgi:hypothetical protein